MSGEGQVWIAYIYKFHGFWKQIEFLQEYYATYHTDIHPDY